MNKFGLGHGGYCNGPATIRFFPNELTSLWHVQSHVCGFRLCRYVWHGVTPWNVGTARFFSHRITGQGVSPGSGSSAQMAEFTRSAFATQLVWRAELPEYCGVSVDVCKRLKPDISSRNRQKATGINLSCVGNEDEPFSVI